MRRFGDIERKELNDAREQLRSALRGIGAHESVVLALERFVEAMIRIESVTQG